MAKEQKEKKRKKKRKAGMIFYACTVLVLGIVIIAFAVFLLFHVQKVQVSGTTYSSKSEITEWATEGKAGRNSIYLMWKFKSGHYKLPPYLEDVDIRLKAPWSVELKVQEKKIVGYFQGKNEYIYFDKDGLVLQMTTEILEGVPCIEGMEAEDATLYKKIKTDNENIFENVLDLTDVLKKTKLKPDKITYEEEMLNLYFEGVHVKLGEGNYENKIEQIPPILEKLGKKTGVLHLEYYGNLSNSISFTEETEKK